MNIYNLPYDKVIERWTDVVLYASKSSDSFSLITEQLKPYQAEPPKCRHDELLDPISGDLLQQEVNVKSWLGTKTSDKHRVLNLYRMSKTTRAWLKTCPNLLDCSRDLPQDICFCRNGKPWLYATIHEKELTLLNPTEADKAFFALQERS